MEYILPQPWSSPSEDYSTKFSFNIPLIITDDFPEFEELDQVVSTGAVNNKPVDDSHSHNISDVFITAQWLYDLCIRHASHSSDVFSARQLANEILSICKSNFSESQLEAKLFELIGESGLDLLMEIVQNRRRLTDESLSDALASVWGDGPSVESVGVNSQPQSQRKKKQQKQQQQQMSSTMDGDGFNTDWLRELGFSSDFLQKERSLGLQKGKSYETSQDNWRDHLAPAGTREYHDKRGLPAGTTRSYGTGFEEVFIPAPPKPAPVPSDQLVRVDQLESWAQLAFEGTKKLNRIQSAVFHAAFNSAENLLICAPTGAGKTNIAMLAFLQLIKQHVSGGELDRGAVKAVYVAPMKALAQEVIAVKYIFLPCHSVERVFVCLSVCLHGTGRGEVRCSAEGIRLAGERVHRRHAAVTAGNHRQPADRDYAREVGRSHA